VGAGIKTNCFEWTIVAVGLVKVACGSRHSIGINEHGRVYGWGDSSQGQLGLTSNPVNRYYRPTSLEILGDVTDITAANNISIFVTENGVVGCGGNHLGQLGLGHKNPVYSPTQILLKNLEVNRIFAGNYTVTMTKDQNLYFTGTGAFGELLFPVKVPIKNVEDVFIGDTYGFAKDTEGKIYGWGSNINGELCEDSSIRGLSKPTELSSL
jgi:alpha-tubulin suppressor-like RCC1 family protein